MSTRQLESGDLVVRPISKGMGRPKLPKSELIIDDVRLGCRQEI